MIIFKKDPDANLDFTVDWTEWLGNDTIVTSTWVVASPAGANPIIISAQMSENKMSHVWLAGGQAGKIYTIENTITTLSGLTDVRSFKVRVKDT